MIIFDYLYFKSYIFLQATRAKINKRQSDDYYKAAILIIIPLFIWNLIIPAFISCDIRHHMFINDDNFILYYMGTSIIYLVIGFVRYGREYKAKNILINSLMNLFG